MRYPPAFPRGEECDNLSRLRHGNILFCSLFLILFFFALFSRTTVWARQRKNRSDFQSEFSFFQ